MSIPNQFDLVPLSEKVTVFYIEAIKGPAIDPIAIQPQLLKPKLKDRTTYIQWHTTTDLLKFELKDMSYDKIKHIITLTLGEKQNTYQMQPLTLELYNQKIKSLNNHYPQFETQTDLINYYTTTNLWVI